MLDKVRKSYDSMAEVYTKFARNDLDRIPSDKAWLSRFAALAACCKGVTLDLGCGPGHIVYHLRGLGLASIGYDISPKLIIEARRAYPQSQFSVGDLSLLEVAEGAVGGIISRYSLIHMPPSDLENVFDEWQRILEPNAPVLISFFAAPVEKAHGGSFEHAVVTAYQFFPVSIEKQLQKVGLAIVATATRKPIEGERQLDHGTILAKKLK